MNHKLFLFFILIFTSASLYSQLDQRSKLRKNQDKEQAISLLGQPLLKPDYPPETRAKLEADYQLALKNFRARPNDPETHIWLGRRLAYLGDYQKAIRTFSDGVYYFPDDPRFLRHRGHRYISTRKFELALDDFERAAKMIEGTEDQVEPDGAPNPAGIPVSSLHSNIWYHLGLTQYLLGDFQGAFQSYQRCYEESDNNDKIVSSGYWLYIISKRLGNADFTENLLADIGKNMKLLENFAYQEMLMFYKSGKTPEDYGLNLEEIMKDPTRAYGLAMYYYLNDNREEAFRIFEDIIKLPSWASFGYIAAESELARVK